MSRNIFDYDSGPLRYRRYLIAGGDIKYSLQFGTFCAREGVEVIRLPARALNLNTYAERCIRSIKEERVSKLIQISAATLRRSLHEYVEHYHLERNHQGRGNQLLIPRRMSRSKASQVDRRSRLGGLLNIDERAAT